MDSGEGVKFELKEEMHDDVVTLKQSKVGKNKGSAELIMEGLKTYKTDTEIIRILNKEFPDVNWNSYDIKSFLSLNSKLVANLARLDKREAVKQSKLHMEIQNHFDKIMKESWQLFDDSKQSKENTTAINALKLLKDTMESREKTLGRFKYGDKGMFINIQNQISDTTKDIQRKLAQAKFKQIPQEDVKVIDVGTKPMEEDED